MIKMNNRLVYTFILLFAFSIICVSTGRCVNSEGSHSKNEAVHDTVFTYVTDDYYRTIDEWEVLIMAIMYVESRYTDDAKNGKQVGYFQITPIYVEEVNKIAGTHYTLHDAFELDKALDMFIIMNDKYNPERDIDKAISLHNKGYEYKCKVKKEMDNIKKYEKMRCNLVDLFAEYD